MKKMKRLLIISTFAFAMVSMVQLEDANAFTDPCGVESPSSGGPFANYATCVENCLNTTSPWTIQRTVCALDCYVSLIGDIVDAII